MGFKFSDFFFPFRSNSHAALQGWRRGNLPPLEEQRECPCTGPLLLPVCAALMHGAHLAFLLGREAASPGDAREGSSTGKLWIWLRAQPQHCSCLVI